MSTRQPGWAPLGLGHTHRWRGSSSHTRGVDQPEPTLASSQDRRTRGPGAAVPTAAPTLSLTWQVDTPFMQHI